LLNYIIIFPAPEVKGGRKRQTSGEEKQKKSFALSATGGAKLWNPPAKTSSGGKIMLHISLLYTSWRMPPKVSRAP
jgi:hypothetical protein